MKVVIFPRFIAFLPPVFRNQAIKVTILPEKEVSKRYQIRIYLEDLPII